MARERRVAREYMAPIKRTLKRLRVSQPFNGLATGAARGALSILGVQSEFLVRHLHRVGHVESRLPNGRVLRLWSRADDWVSNLVYWRGWAGYEPETAPLFYLLATRSAVMVDVGAYVGFFTLLAAHANPAGRVYAFEPLPAAYARLLDHVARNGLANVVCEPAAVSREKGQADFFHAAAEATQDIASDGHSSIPCSSSLSASFMSSASGVVSTRVAVTTLDGYLAGRQGQHVDLMKIDTETTEPDVLDGAAGLLKAKHPMIFCEVLPGPETGPRLQALLFPLGYRAYHLTPRGPEPRDRIEGHPTWLNYLFAARAPEEVAVLHREALTLAGRGGA